MAEANTLAEGMWFALEVEGWSPARVAARYAQGADKKTFEKALRLLEHKGISRATVDKVRLAARGR